MLRSITGINNIEDEISMRRCDTEYYQETENSVYNKDKDKINFTEKNLNFSYYVIKLKFIISDKCSESAK